MDVLYRLRARLGEAHARFFFRIERKVDTIMATVADVQAALAANETKQATIISLLQTEAATLKDTQAQLAAAIKNGSDEADLQAVLDKMTADGDAMDAAIAAAAAAPATPPAATTVAATGILPGGIDTTGGAISSISGSASGAVDTSGDSITGTANRGAATPITGA